MKIQLHSKGMNLIELLITLMIFSLLTGFAYNSYNTHLIKIRRLEAKENILNWATQLERYYSEHDTYIGVPLNMPFNTDNGWYQLNITTLEPHYYQITAIPQGTQRQDQNCGKFIFDSEGEKNISGEGKVKECW